MFWKMSHPIDSSAPHQEQRCLGQVKRLMQALIVSGTVNILLLAFVLYGFFGNGMLVFRDTLKPRLLRPTEAVATTERSVVQALQSYQQLSLQQLIAKLEDPTRLQEGYSERELALGYLVWRHHFNVGQALIDAPPTSHQHIPIRMGNYSTQLTIFPELNARQHAAVVQFAKTERWPLTSEGLFHELKRSPESSDTSLAEAFFLTPEFLTLQRTFARSDIEISKRDLLNLATEFNWPTFKAAVARLHVPPESAKTAVLEWMTDYLQKGSVRAAQWATKIAGSQQGQALVAEVLQPSEVKSITPPAKIHVVKEGESLWKIAKNYHVDIAKLKAHNRLNSDLVRPGANLCIP